MKIGRRNSWEPEILKDPVTPKWVIGWIIRGAILLGLIIWLIWAQNNFLAVRSYIYTEVNVPKTFVDYTIVHVSDLHNSSLPVVSKVSRQDPDLILVTGGLADDNGRVNKSISTINRLGKIAPTYYVLGEDDSNYIGEITGGIDSSVTFLEGSSVDIPSPEVNTNDFIDKYIGKRIISMANKGDEDATSYIEYTKESLAEDANSFIKITGLSSNEELLGLQERIYSLIGTDKSIFQIILCSDAQLFDEVSKADVMMYFTGSVHGDTSKYDGYKKGIYAKSGTTMVLNGGVGNRSEYASRIFNFPEIRCISLSDGTIKNENPIEKVLGYLMPKVGTKFDNDKGFTTHRYTYEDKYNTTGQYADP